MPHCIVEYTNNLGPEARIRDLLDTLAAKFRDSDGVFPTGGIRVRAIRLDDYVIADGQGDDAFVHITTKIGPGRDPAFKQRFFDALFELVKAHFHVLAEQRPLALSLYVEEGGAQGSYKFNTIHARLKTAQGHA
ncbi:5-carboxymethyl-2-hydroxymuconate Delta-isomerase [Pararobbsia silviterrae]|uniref:5-carboxymethyl-2-hydroxymuconate isomerase n=1 Tax=Pararobbsia silviterrae TaxID=1792498 RepID=A0A494Y4N3_9BURK|nr:5-carboxymethyl-2-hydroxymuconate Delta-isomerase [Pararobbsia silviterrae]RKP57676.1 5-carboxymethyl-2-hydroxymuconate isomerase [Pararobbsia silviterrae]